MQLEIAAAAGVLCQHAAGSCSTVNDGGGSELEFKRGGVVAVIRRLGESGATKEAGQGHGRG